MESLILRVSCKVTMKTFLRQIKVHKMAAMFCHFECQPNTRCPITRGEHIKKDNFYTEKNYINTGFLFLSKGNYGKLTLFGSSARVTWRKEEKNIPQRNKS